MNSLSILMLSFVALCLLTFAIRDFRRGEHLWSALSATALVILVAIPVPSHTISVDIPEAQK